MTDDPRTLADLPIFNGKGEPPPLPFIMDTGEGNPHLWTARGPLSPMGDQPVTITPIARLIDTETPT